MIYDVKDNYLMLKKLSDNFGVYLGEKPVSISSRFSKLNVGDMVVFDNNDSSVVSVEFEDAGLGVMTTFYFILIKNIIAVMYVGDVT